MGDQAIGAQARDFGASVPNTVATSEGAPTTGQAKNVAGHMVFATEISRDVAEGLPFDIVNTTAKPYRGERDPGMPGVHTLQTSLPGLRYEPLFEFIPMSIDMGLERKVRLQMFVRGPYTGLHRYVASAGNVTRRADTTKDVGAAVGDDMAHGLLDPRSLYWRPPLFHAAYPLGYYSFTHESAMILGKLLHWAFIYHGTSLSINPNLIMLSRYQWHAHALAHGYYYPKPGIAPADEDEIPWQLPIFHRALEVAVREYPSLT